MDTVTWTDDKIDVLAEKVDHRLSDLEARVRRLETQIEIESVRSDERYKAVDQRFVDFNRRLDQLAGNARGSRQ
jgi:chaperonin cofactor prefoldin